MMLPFFAHLGKPESPSVTRDVYGVPHIQAANVSDAFFQAGYAVAQDRLWQMENSRRLARGRLAEVFGKAFLNSDREILTTSYTDEELTNQFQHLSPRAQTILESYVKGINTYIQRTSPNHLPDGYTKNGFKPEPWTILDSVAICVRFLQQFGRGGAGELRNMAMLAYLGNQKPLSRHVLDVFDDMNWWNDPDAIPTISPGDDPLANSHPKFYQADRKTTEAQLAKLPKLSLMQLLGAIRVSTREESTRVASNLAVPFHTGSYCVVVGPKQSATGYPLLLSGPQMGMRVPSIVHEMSISAPGFATVGMDIPGIPGVIIGQTKTFTWGITSGVADTDDIFYFPSDGSTYQFGQKSMPLRSIKRSVKVKDGNEVIVEERRTDYGPVVLETTNGVFAKRCSYWQHEMNSFDAWVNLWQASKATEVDGAMKGASMNFNFFYATDSGDFGWRYTGLVPKRASEFDPRLPTPGNPEADWKGFLTPDEMPHVRNPKSGLLANWNNKPTAWWPNFDTPAWGKVFHNSTLLATVQKPSLTIQDLEFSAWSIARTDEQWLAFKPAFELGKGSPGYDLISGYDGQMSEGSRQASNFQAFIEALRQELFLNSTGNMLNPDYFKVVLQPSLVLRALEGMTKFNFLGDRTAKQVVIAALAKVAYKPRPPYRADSFKSWDPTPIPYSNRGTTIQLVECCPSGPRGRNVLPPGVAETGPHRNDQASLARAWRYKPMKF